MLSRCLDFGCVLPDSGHSRASLAVLDEFADILVRETRILLDIERHRRRYLLGSCSGSSGSRVFPCGISAKRPELAARVHTELQSPSGVTFGLSALADTLIAATICRSLYKMRSGFAKSDKLIDKLMAFTVGMSLTLLDRDKAACGSLMRATGSGLLTSVASFIALLMVSNCPAGPPMRNCL